MLIAYPKLNAQVARALLVKELPLRLRLLGIRMTNLRDQDTPTNPFALAAARSPSKTGKVDEDPDDDLGDNDDEEDFSGEAAEDVTSKDATCPICQAALPRDSREQNRVSRIDVR